MSILESALEGALIGGLAGGVVYAVRLFSNKGKGAPPAARAKAANTGEQNGTIAPVRISDAENVPGPRQHPKQEERLAGRPAVNREKPQSTEAIGWLVLKSGTDKGARYDLSAGEIKIGRSENCRVRIKDDEEVSREHAMLRVNAQECTLCDLGSRNGTFLNGARVESPRRLQEGDTLRIGGAEMVFIRA